MHPFGVSTFLLLSRAKQQLMAKFAFIHPQQPHTMTPHHAFLLQCQPLPKVRIALIGLGMRGMKTLVRYAFIPDAEIRYIVDVDDAKLRDANLKLAESGRPLTTTLQGKEAWKTVCEKDDVDLVYICTEWHTHAEMAIRAMRCGKHVAVEVPAATTLEECRELVRTAEETQRHCFMTENCCYDFFHLCTLEMHRRGLFGRINHCEGAYIHDLTPEAVNTQPATSANSWIERSCTLHGGNPYPTHGIGPIAQLLGFHRTDRMTSLVSLTSGGKEKNNTPIGRINTTLIQTESGATIMLQLDVVTHRPYSRLQTICGSKAFAQKYPVATLQNEAHTWVGEEAEKHLSQFATSESARLWLEGEKMHVPNAMNYAMDARLIHCLKRGLPLDIDVYDAAEWSCLAELTRLSAEANGTPVEVPNFLQR